MEGGMNAMKAIGRRTLQFAKWFARWFVKAKRWQQIALVVAFIVVVIGSATSKKPVPEASSATTSSVAPVLTTTKATELPVATQPPATTTAPTSPRDSAEVAKDVTAALAGDDAVVLAAMTLVRSDDPSVPSGKAFDRMVVANVHQLCEAAASPDSTPELLALTLGGTAAQLGAGSDETKALGYATGIAPTYCPDNAKMIEEASAIIQRASSRT
jgi:hypothetical protein